MPSKLTIALLFLSLSIQAYGQNKWTNKQLTIIKVMNALSETTAPDGKGADTYGAFISEDFSRWTIGSQKINKKGDWVEGIREWFDDGWRVSAREQDIIEILIKGEFAHTRRIVIETYLGPEGETSKSKAALAEVWKKENDRWLLYRVNVHPMDLK